MATLKISDLSVGDWVMCNGFKATIAGYNAESGSIQVLTRQKNKMWFCIDDIEPIPITAEILEKNGFEEYSERKWECEDDSPNPTLIQMCTPDGVMWFISFPILFGLTWDSPIYHIHELQHLCRLAGVDKEINL